MQKSAKRAETAKAWPAEAALALGGMVDVTNKLLDQVTIDDVATNATVMAGDVVQIATGTLVQALAELRGLTNALNAGRDAIFQATNSIQAELMLVTLTNLPGMSQAKSTVVESEAARGEQVLKVLVAMNKKVIAQAKEQAAEKARLEKEKAAAEKKLREEEVKKRQAVANEKLAKAEISLIEVTRKSTGAFVQKNQFKEALEAMAALEKGFKSVGGKNALKLAVERFQMMVDLKAFIIDGLRNDFKAKPDSGLRYGWLVNGVPSRDVLGADEEKVMVRGGAVPWVDVSPAQLIRFAQLYAGADGLSRQEAGRQLLGAAAYVLEYGAGSEGSKKKATELMDEAVKADSAVKEKAQTILPELF
jgi:hypothetical protein